MVTRRRLALVGVVASLVFATSVTPAFANYFAGGWNTPNGISPGARVVGTEITIDTENPSVRTSSSAWNMIQKHDTGTAYMQVGWAKDSPSWTSSRYFTEVNLYDLPGYHSTYWHGNAASGTHLYKITDDSVRYYLMIDGVTKLTVTKADLAWSPNQVTFMGETIDYYDQFPGRATDKCMFQNGAYKRPDGTWWKVYYYNVQEHFGVSTAGNSSSSFTVHDGRYW